MSRHYFLVQPDRQLKGYCRIRVGVCLGEDAPDLHFTLGLGLRECGWTRGFLRRKFTGEQASDEAERYAIRFCARYNRIWSSTITPFRVMVQLITAYWSVDELT